MPKIYEYLGLLIFFYSNEHQPIHVHAKSGEYESKAELIIVNGKVDEIIIKQVKGRYPLKESNLQKFKEFLNRYAEDIVQKWIDYFIHHKRVKFEKITKRVK